MLLDWAEVDASVIPTACARVLGSTVYMYHDQRWVTYSKGSVLNRTVKVWTIFVFGKNPNYKQDCKNQPHHLASNWILVGVAFVLDQPRLVDRVLPNRCPSPCPEQNGLSAAISPGRLLSLF